MDIKQQLADALRRLAALEERFDAQAVEYAEMTRRMERLNAEHPDAGSEWERGTRLEIPEPPPAVEVCMWR